MMQYRFRILSIILGFGLPLLPGCSAANDDALFKAIRARDTKQVERILAEGNVVLDPPQQPYQVNKPLAYAAAYGNLDIVKAILARGADINGQVAYGDVPLIKAAEHDNREIIKHLLEHGADVNRPNAFGVSPFIGFCACDDVELVQLALQHGGKVNEAYVQQTQQNQGKKNYNALQTAVAYGKTDVVKLLLANGGDPSITDQSGKTCLDLAQEKNHTDMIGLLKANPAKPVAGDRL
jgi:ankyrin repeat protein